MSPRAPVLADATRLAAWLLHHVRGQHDPLPQQLGRDALVLLDHLALALRGSERPLHLAEADDGLLLLRLHLRLGGQLGLFTEEQLVYALEQADGIGRQLGAWQRSLEGVS